MYDIASLHSGQSHKFLLSPVEVTLRPPLIVCDGGCYSFPQSIKGKYVRAPRGVDESMSLITGSRTNFNYERGFIMAQCKGW